MEKMIEILVSNLLWGLKAFFGLISFLALVFCGLTMAQATFQLLTGRVPEASPSFFGNLMPIVLIFVSGFYFFRTLEGDDFLRKCELEEKAASEAEADKAGAS